MTSTQIVRVGEDRIIEADGPDAADYSIVRAHDDSLARRFRTGGVNGKTADESAEANLADWSEYHFGEFLLFRDGLLMASAENGIICSLRPDNPALVRQGRAA